MEDKTDKELRDESFAQNMKTKEIKCTCTHCHDSDYDGYCAFYVEDCCIHCKPQQPNTKEEWNMGYPNCFECKYNHPHGHEVEQSLKEECTYLIEDCPIHGLNNLKEKCKCLGGSVLGYHFDHCPLSKMFEPPIEWEEEFEKKYGRNSNRMTFLNENKYYWNKDFYDDIKAFFKQELATAKKEEREKIANRLDKFFFTGGAPDKQSLLKFIESLK